jgi:hypothetical protein
MFEASLPHLSAGKDDEAGEDDRAKCQLNRKKVK